jgi:hypothetical protein
MREAKSKSDSIISELQVRANILGAVKEIRVFPACALVFPFYWTIQVGRNSSIQINGCAYEISV